MNLSSLFTLQNIIAVGTIGVVVVAGWTRFQSTDEAMRVRFDVDEARQEARWRDLDKRMDGAATAVAARFAAVETKAAPIENLGFRVGAVEGSIAALNARVDRVADTMKDGFDRLSGGMAAMTTRIEVLNETLKRLAPPPPASAPYAPGKRTLMQRAERDFPPADP